MKCRMLFAEAYHFGRKILYAIYRAIRAVCFVCPDNYFRRGMDGKGIEKRAHRHRHCAGRVRPLVCSAALLDGERNAQLSPRR